MYPRGKRVPAKLVAWKPFGCCLKKLWTDVATLEGTPFGIRTTSEASGRRDGVIGGLAMICGIMWSLFAFAAWLVVDEPTRLFFSTTTLLLFLYGSSLKEKQIKTLKSNLEMPTNKMVITDFYLSINCLINCEHHWRILIFPWATNGEVFTSRLYIECEGLWA